MTHDPTFKDRLIASLDDPEVIDAVRRAVVTPAAGGCLCVLNRDLAAALDNSNAVMALLVCLEDDLKAAAQRREEAPAAVGGGLTLIKRSDALARADEAERTPPCNQHRPPPVA